MKKLEDGTYTVKKTIEDYEKLVEEQKKALKILNKRLRDKEKEILELNKQKRHLRNIIRTKQYKDKLNQKITVNY